METRHRRWDAEDGWWEAEDDARWDAEDGWWEAENGWWDAEDDARWDAEYGWRGDDGLAEEVGAERVDEWDDRQVPTPVRLWGSIWTRPHTKLALGLSVVMIVAAVVGTGRSEPTGASASVDPTSGYPWCNDPLSDYLGDPVGDGYGWENRQSCRVRPEHRDERGRAIAGPDAVDPSRPPGPPTTAAASGASSVDHPGSPSAPDHSEAEGSDPTEAGSSGETSGVTPDEAGSRQAPAGGHHDPGSGGDPASGSPEPVAPAAAGPAGSDHGANLAMIRQQRVRNRNHDDSPYRDVPSAQLVPENHYGPRSDYLGNPGGNPEQSFPVANGGQFRAGCEFSHFAYDDPIVYPDQPGAAHLHMFFGNTDANAYSDADSILDSGSSTCNGQELNRTAYWAPAMFDAQGNVRIPERIVVYYKGEGLARGNAEMFPEGAAMIASVDLNTVGNGAGGAAGKFSFTCSENYSGMSSPAANTIPSCDGNHFLDLYGSREDPHVVLEMNVKFPQCWNGKDPGNPANYRHPTQGSWYYSLCDGEFGHTLVNLEYFINYEVEIGETTAGWYLSSDVDPATGQPALPGGSTNHADWLGGWHAETQRMFLDNCVNYRASVPSGCGFGYLTDGGPDSSNPYSGPALRYREQYTGPVKVPAEELHRELCPAGGDRVSSAAAAYCRPG